VASLSGESNRRRPPSSLPKQSRPRNDRTDFSASFDSVPSASTPSAPSVGFHGERVDTAPARADPFPQPPVATHSSDGLMAGPMRGEGFEPSNPYGTRP